VGGAFDINVEKSDHRRLDVLQNSHTKFEDGQAHAFEPHLVYSQGWTLHVAFFFVVEDLVFARTMQ
jgi:hypothetical protein